MDNEVKTAKAAREALLAHSVEIIETFVKLSLGKLYKFEGDAELLEVAFKAVLPAMKLEDDMVSVGKTETKTDMVNSILAQMNNGDITPMQAQGAIEAINKGFDVAEIEGILESLKERNGG